MIEFRKNTTQTIRVSWQSFRGEKRLDIRQFLTTRNNPTPFPTKNGVSIPADKAKTLLKALQQAINEENQPATN